MPVKTTFVVIAAVTLSACQRDTRVRKETAADDRLAVAAEGPKPAVDPLPSWRSGATKTKIVEFVSRITTAGSPDFVSVPERIAVFDNDGTLWTEVPFVQLEFVLARVKELAPSHPEWKTKQPFKGVLEGNIEAVKATGEKGIVELIAATSTGMTSEEFARIQTKWIADARHPRFHRPYTDLVYQPMLEVLRYLREKGFKTYIVSGGGADFMRPWTERVYGIPPEQVIGSSGKLRYEIHDGAPVLMRLPEVDFVDDKAGKPVGIQRFIGRRPIMAFGNSDGDFQMLEWTTSGKGARFGLLVHHTDAVREFAYDREGSLSVLSLALEEAPKHGWIVADMKQDWAVVFPFQKATAH